MKYFTNLTRLLSFFSLTILIASQLSSQTRPAKQLPPIDYSQINPEVYEAGRFRIKFKAIAEKQLETPNQLKSQSGVAVTGINEVDALNRQFNVGKGKALLAEIYNSPLKSASLQTERHKKSGLHLWYEFETGKDVDLAELIQRYKKLESVEIIEPVFKIVQIKPVENPFQSSKNPSATPKNWIPDDERFTEQWHYHNTGQNNGTEDSDIDLPEAWKAIQGNPNVIVAVIDQGVDFNHPDLAGNIWPPVGPEGESTSPGDHGTHVAGTIAALNNNGFGVSGIAGGSGNNDGVRIMSLDLFNGQHGMSTLEMNVYAADNGAAISQNSWGYVSSDYYNQSDLDGIDYFNEYGGGDVLEGGITFFAAGNDNDDGNWYPGCYEGAIAVAATNHNDQISWYSNYGDWVDISAPGGETSSTYQAGVLSTVINGNYDFYQGTSMACPHVSGVAALVLSLAPGFLTNDELANILLTSTDDHYASNPGYEGLMGSGRLNAFNAVEMAQEYLGNVRNPSSFSAQAISESSISLSWELNENSNPVMIALSETGEFGSPNDGSSYNVGDQLPDGGVILYAGNDLMTEIEDLQRNTNYYFKIWSFDENIEYSYGRSAQTKTFSPQISLSSEIIDYKTTYIGYPKSYILEISNTGESDMTISNISFSNNSLSSPEIPTIIEPDTNFEWEIIFSPTQTGSFSETIFFETNVPGQEQIIISVYGEASDQIPAMEYSPAAIEETLNTGESTTHTVELRNTGDADLTYNIITFPERTQNPTTTTSQLQIQGSPVPAQKEKISGTSYNDREIKESGGSSEAGYYWETSNYEWYDISDGTPVNLGDDSSQSNIPLEFTFKYYENYFSSIMVKSNGWVSFTNNSSWYPDCIPGEAGAICPFGIDLLPDAQGEIRYKTIGSEPSRKFIVEYNNIRLYSSSLRNTFQIVLSEGSNTIHFQYKSIEKSPYAIGIDNYDASKGIGNCGTEENFLNPEIVTNDLSIGFRPASISYTSPSSGIIEAGQTTSVSVNINATKLSENTYYQDIAIVNNDPRQEEVIIPLTLHVIGIPDLQINTDTVFLEPTFLGTTTQAKVVLDNSTGTKAVNISNISVSGPPFEVGSWPENIAPQETDTIEINLSPEQKDHFEGSITIFSDDPDIPEKKIVLMGEGIIAPSIEATPALFDVELYAGDSISKLLTISNTANNSIPLDVSLRIEEYIDQEGEPLLIPGTPNGLKALVPAPKVIKSENTDTHTAPKSENGAKVLFLTSLGSSGLNFHHAMEALPNVSKVDSVVISENTPNTAYLLHYDVVVMATSYGMADRILLGNNLADYIDQGGRLCILNGAFCQGGAWTIAGRITEEEYLPLEPNTYSFTTTSCDTFINHPLTENLTSLETGVYSHSSSQGAGISLGTFDSGYSCLAYNPDKPIVAINVFPSGEYYNEELMPLMENTINWMANSQKWLSADNNQLNVETGESQEINLKFNASGMDTGSYTANIFLKSNDPALPELTIPVTLNIIEAAGIQSEKDTVRFGEVPTGREKSVFLEISNTGSDTLEITSLNIDDQHFSCNTETPIYIAPGETTTINPVFAPSNATNYSGQLTIISNDPSDEGITIHLFGSGHHTAQIQSDPETLEEELFEGENANKTITIANTGQNTPLTYSVNVDYGTTAGNIGGGPDDGGYKWHLAGIESIDISDATDLSLSDDDYQVNIPLGFEFQYYGETFSSVNIMSNGWISFSDYDTWFPSCVPGQNGAIAPYVTDLRENAGDTIQYKTIGSAPYRQFIIDFNTSIYGVYSTEHFQIILEESTNNIKFQYLEISKTPREVGISSPNNETGLGNCAQDSCYIPLEHVVSGNAIDFQYIEDNWLSLTPGFGSINAGEEQELQVTLPTDTLLQGTYYAIIKINNNDPFLPIVEIPVTLTVNELQQYTVSFNYFNQFAEPLTEATLTVNGQAIPTETTEANDLTPGIYEYSITKEGYSQGENASGEVVIDNRDITIDATLIALLQQVNLIAYPAGSGTFNGAQSYYTDQRVYLEALPSGGFQFYNWTDQENNIKSEQAGYSFSMPPYDITLTGNFGVFSSLSDINEIPVSVFPNPAEDIIQVRLTKPEEVELIEIISPKGEIIKQEKTNGNETIPFIIGELSPSTYLLRVTYADDVRYFKFVKK